MERLSRLTNSLIVASEGNSVERIDVGVMTHRWDPSGDRKYSIITVPVLAASF